MMEIEIHTEGRTIDDIIDQVEAAIYKSGTTIEAPVVHQFLPNLYVREILMPKGTWAVSLTHKAFNPYFIMSGKLSIFSGNDGIQNVEAPFRGITSPLTRRVLYMHENTSFVTCHPTSIFPENDSVEAFDDAVKQVEEQITMARYNKLLGGYLRNNVLTPMIESSEEELLEDVNIYS